MLNEEIGNLIEYGVMLRQSDRNTEKAIQIRALNDFNYKMSDREIAAIMHNIREAKKNGFTR